MIRMATEMGMGMGTGVGMVRMMGSGDNGDEIL